MPTGWPLAIAIMLGLQAVIYTVDGWDGIIYFGEEVRNPGRDIPRAIFGSVFSIMGIYLLLNLVALYILPMKEIWPEIISCSAPSPTSSSEISAIPSSARSCSFPC